MKLFGGGGNAASSGDRADYKAAKENLAALSARERAAGITEETDEFNDANNAAAQAAQWLPWYQR